MRHRIGGGIAALMLGLLPAAGVGATPKFGLGIVLGEPSGIAGKYWTGSSTAVAGAMAWSTIEDNQIHLQADVLWHDFGVFGVDRGSLPLYYGVGGLLRLRDGSDRLGARFPIGLAYRFEGGRFDAFMELAPTLDLSPRTDVDLSAGLGGRYFFR